MKKYSVFIVRGWTVQGIIILFLYFISCCITANGQGTPAWKIFNTSNSGIADNVVFCSAFQNNGVKWFGTNIGLSKLDGTTWTTYRMANSDLPANIVRCLMFEEPDKLWIGTDGIVTPGGGGLAVFDGSTWNIYNPANSVIPDDWVTEIITDKKGNKWIGTDNGLVKIDTASWIVLPTGSTTYYHGVSSLAVENDTVILIGTAAGFSRYNNIYWTVYTIWNSGLPENNISEVRRDTLGYTWIGTNPGGLAKFDGTNWIIYNTSNSGIPANDIMSIDFANDYTIWIGTWSGGLASLKDTTWTTYNTSNSPIPSNVVYSVDIDKFGNKWIGTSAGLAVFNENGFTGIDDSFKESFGSAPLCLDQNQPNPFISSTNITFSLYKSGKVTLRIMNILGEEIAKPIEANLKEGKYSIKFEGANLTPGIYTCILTMDNYMESCRMIKEN